MTVNGLGQSMIGSKAPRAVKQPAKTPAALKGTKAGKVKGAKGSGGKLKMANGTTSGVMKTAF